MCNQPVLDLLLKLKIFKPDMEAVVEGAATAEIEDIRYLPSKREFQENFAFHLRVMQVGQIPIVKF